MERKITIEEQGAYEGDYQMAMLKANSMKYLLPIGSRWIDESSFFDYDVTGKVSMQAIYEKNLLTGEELVTFLEQLLLVRKEIEKYLLHEDCLLLKPEYIFFEKNQYYFCYYPLSKESFWESFRKLTEYFVKKMDYQDSQGVQMMFALHQGVMQENYSLERLVKECQKLLASEPKDSETKDSSASEEEQDVYPWITEVVSPNVIRENNDMWTPMKRFLNKHKKSKWGDWDDLHIEDLVL